MNFKPGDKAIYVGGGANRMTFNGQLIAPIHEILLNPGDEVTIIEPSISRIDGSRSYIVDFQGRLGEHNVREIYLRKPDTYDITAQEWYQRILRGEQVEETA